MSLIIIIKKINKFVLQLFYKSLKYFSEKFIITKTSNNMSLFLQIIKDTLNISETKLLILMRII